MAGTANLARKVERTDSQISQIMGKHPTRNIGRHLARYLERKLEKEPFWLDSRPDSAPVPESRMPVESVDTTADSELAIIIDQWPLLDVGQRKRLAADALMAATRPAIPTLTDIPVNHKNVPDYLVLKKPVF